MSQTVAVLNQKGGVGKTTTAINLGAYLAKAGKSVLLVDADPQGNSTSGLAIDKNSETTTYEIMLGSGKVENALQETGIPGLMILPANTNLAAAETELVNHQGREAVLKNALTNLDFDFILIDCPPALSLLTINALVAANSLLVPVQAEYYAMEGLGQLMDIFQRVKQTMNPDIYLLGVVVTMYNSRTTLGEQVVDELEKYFGEAVFKTKIPRNVRLAEAPSHGKPISEHDKWSKGARAYKQLAKEVIERTERGQHGPK